MDAANLHISPVIVHMINKTFFYYIVIFPYFKCFQPFPFEELIDDALFSFVASTLVAHNRGTTFCFSYTNVFVVAMATRLPWKLYVCR